VWKEGGARGPEGADRAGRAAKTTGHGQKRSSGRTPGLQQLLLLSTWLHACKPPPRAAALPAPQGALGGAALDGYFDVRRCPKLDQVVSTRLRALVTKDPSIIPALVRLVFHDSFSRVGATSASPHATSVSPNATSASPCHVSLPTCHVSGGPGAVLFLQWCAASMGHPRARPGKRPFCRVKGQGLSHRRHSADGAPWALDPAVTECLL